MIRSFQEQDLSQVTAIFNHYVEHDTCTFQIVMLSLKQMKAKLDDIQGSYPVLVIENNHEILGFAYGSRWRAKQAYDLSVESSIYIKPNQTQMGLGSKLYHALIEQLIQQKFHLLIAAITLPNAGSIKLHEALGFLPVGIFTQAGRKFDQWHDVGFWQKRI